MIINEDITTLLSGRVNDSVTAAVITEFAQFCRIPHGSGNEKQIIEYLFQRLLSYGLCPDIDAWGNLICDIPASEGCEDSPLTALQGHVDMVCAVKDGSYSPETDPIMWKLTDDAESGRLIMCTDGRSSLGADCGLGNAVLMWAVFTGGCQHGPLRLIFTVEEEWGLAGAKKMDASVFDDVSYVINVDGFHWGRLIAGSAGGSRETYTLDAQICLFSEDVLSCQECLAFEICLSDFHGGHSGYDIDKGRANAIKLLNGLLTEMESSGMEYRLALYDGGIGHNVIPGEAAVVLILKKSERLKFQKFLGRLMNRIVKAYAITDPDGVLRYHETALPAYVLAPEACRRLTGFIDEIEDGVFSLMEELDGVVDTSSNLGVVRFHAEDSLRHLQAEAPEEEMDQSRNQKDENEDGLIFNRKEKEKQVPIHVMSFVRSMTPSYHDDVIAAHRRAAQKYGFLEEIDEYRTWRFDSSNPLLRMAADAYRRITGCEPEITAVHVGLEPSAFCEKSDRLSMINIGADIIDPHTVHERVHVDTIRPFALVIDDILKRISGDIG